MNKLLGYFIYFVASIDKVQRKKKAYPMCRVSLKSETTANFLKQ